VKQLVFVHHGDFVESISEVKKSSQTIQLSLKESKKIYPTLSSNRLKETLYNFKFLYYLYRNYFVNTNNAPTNNRDDKDIEMDYQKFELLLNYIGLNYDIKNIVLIFSPDSDPELTELVKEYNFETLTLKVDNYKSWQLENDSHWSCYGHREAAKQVAKFINESSF
jgi:hypothetical protein